VYQVKSYRILTHFICCLTLENEGVREARVARRIARRLPGYQSHDSIQKFIHTAATRARTSQRQNAKNRCQTRALSPYQWSMVHRISYHHGDPRRINLQYNDCDARLGNQQIRCIEKFFRTDASGAYPLLKSVRSSQTSSSTLPISPRTSVRRSEWLYDCEAF
jgi:hypothetical protein